MSKRDLKQYLQNLAKDQLEEQLLDLYTRFKSVKTYYDFVFKPDEQKLLEDAKFKIGKEYFPVNGRKAKARRSVAQKIIKHYVTLGVDPYVVSDVMLYNIEVSQLYTKDKVVKQEAFYKSMLKHFREAAQFIAEHGMVSDFDHRLRKVVIESKAQEWMNWEGFEASY